MDDGFSIKQQATVNGLYTTDCDRAINCWQKNGSYISFFIHHQKKMQTSGAKPWFCQDARNNDTTMVEHICYKSSQRTGQDHLIASQALYFWFPKTNPSGTIYMKRQVISQQWRGRTTASEVNPLKRHETGDVLLHQISNPKFSRLDCAFTTA